MIFNIITQILYEQQPCMDLQDEVFSTTCSMDVQGLSLFTFKNFFLNARKPDCPASSQSGTGMNKNHIPLPHHLHFISSTSPSPPRSKRESALNGSVHLSALA
jgi:hypothetical protein